MTRTYQTATQILWYGAGQPLTAECVPYTGPCWWCGQPAPGHGATIKVIADTFPDRNRAARRDSVMLCAPCAWTWCDTVALPVDYARERIARLCEQGRRARLSIRGGPAERVLVLRLADGRIGLWSTAENTRAEEAWAADAARQRVTPSDVGPVRYRETVDLADLAPEATEKFRCYHHFGTPTSWEVATDADKPRIREWVLHPPSGPYTVCIGDGKKHAAIYARPSYGAPGVLAGVYYDGRTLDYVPEDFAALLGHVESLVRAGADDDQIVSGRYRGAATPAWMSALRLDEPAVAEVRGSPILDLAIYLRRTRKELTENAPDPIATAPVPPVRGADPPLPPPDARRTINDAPVGPPPPGRPAGPVGGQLRLFG